MKRIALLVVLVLAFAAVVAVAQDDEEPDYTVLACDGAQEWYDTTGEVFDFMAESLSIMASTEDSAVYRENETIARAFADEIAAIEYPECVEYAYLMTISGTDKLITSIESFALGDLGNYIAETRDAYRDIGEARGYLVALGVEISTGGEEAEDE